MNREQLKRLIDIAAGRVKADLVIKNCRIVDVTAGIIREGDIAFAGSIIAGTGSYEGHKEIDAKNMYAMPGLIDSHIHIESAYVTPEEIGRLLVPRGTSTIIADPHEIVNVAGLDAMDYMLEAAKLTPLHIEYVLPSCVPATPFEHAGAVLEAEHMHRHLADPSVLGLGEFMNFPGVIHNVDSVIDKIIACKEHGKIIDGHSPGLTGKQLNAYAVAGILADHECSTIEEMEERLSAGMYILMRQGSACHNLEDLLPVVSPLNSRRCLLCSDDRQPKTILTEGHLDDHLRRCVRFGLDPIMAVQMATINAAEAFGLHDRGGILPGRRADVILVEDLVDFKVRQVFLDGEEVARDGDFLPEVKRHTIQSVTSSFHVRDFSVDKLRMKLRGDRVHVIDILPGGVVTGKGITTVNLNQEGDFVYNPDVDIVKVAVVERHQNTGNVAVALLRGYGIKHGAVALSIAHDSHNIIVTGTNDDDMAFAVEALIAQNGGIVLVRDGVVLESMPMPVGGIMSDQSGEWVMQKLIDIHDTAWNQLGVQGDVEPVMTLCFMSLAVIPEIKLTDMGLFDVETFDFISVEAESL